MRGHSMAWQAGLIRRRAAKIQQKALFVQRYSVSASARPSHTMAMQTVTTYKNTRFCLIPWQCILFFIIIIVILGIGCRSSFDPHPCEYRRTGSLLRDFFASDVVKIFLKVPFGDLRVDEFLLHEHRVIRGKQDLSFISVDYPFWPWVSNGQRWLGDLVADTNVHGHLDQRQATIAANFVRLSIP